MHMNSDPRRRWYRPGPSRSRGFVKLMLARSAGIHVASSLLLASLALSLAPSPAGADPRRLADSTWTDSWKLPNGLWVVTRDIRGATGVAMTVAYGFGSDQDPTSREGWASLLAYVDFLSAAGEYPERTLDELASSRPLGWRIEVGPRYTRLTEVAKTEQLPGVLHQMALRLRQAAPSAKVLAAARKAVQAELAQNYRDNLANALHYGVPSVATADSGAALRYAGGKGVDGAALPDVQAAIRTWYVPAKAVLSLAGNLSGSGIDVRRVIANEFGSIPAGSPAAFPPAAAMHPAGSARNIARGCSRCRSPRSRSRSTATCSTACGGSWVDRSTRICGGVPAPTPACWPRSAPHRRCGRCGAVTSSGRATSRGSPRSTTRRSRAGSRTSSTPSARFSSFSSRRSCTRRDSAIAPRSSD